MDRETRAYGAIVRLNISTPIPLHGITGQQASVLLPLIKKAACRALGEVIPIGAA
jgi:hypothetical protein